jgi:hypothetical protein
VSCEPFQDLLAHRELGVLAPEDAPRLAEHLAACPACRAEAEAWQHVGRAFEGLRPRRPVSPRVWERIEAETGLGRPRVPAAMPRKSRSPVLALLAMAALFIISALPSLWTAVSDPDRPLPPDTLGLPEDLEERPYELPLRAPPLEPGCVFDPPLPARVRVAVTADRLGHSEVVRRLRGGEDAPQAILRVASPLGPGEHTFPVEVANLPENVRAAAGARLLVRVVRRP